MSEVPWLTIVGLGEDGPNGLPPASHAALVEAEVIIGPPRHLSLLPANLAAEQVAWPVPFEDGLALLDGLRGRQVVALASGDPFWFGAGSVIARRLDPGEWRALPGVSVFSMAAARMGWPLERTICLGLHAAPLGRMRPHLSPGARLIVLLRDGNAVADLRALLCDHGFGATQMSIMEALGGPRERVTHIRAAVENPGVFRHPLCVALDISGPGPALPRCSGLPDDTFQSDGQITKRPVRALTLSALAPKPGERLWDIGGGSGSVAIEWLLSHPETQAISIEPRPDRAARIRINANRLGVDRLDVVAGQAPEVLADLAAPDAVFVGGGLSEAMLQALWAQLAPGTRLVVNAVTLESEALMAAWHGMHGGDLMRISISNATPLGSRRGWQASYPIVQWSVTR